MWFFEERGKQEYPENQQTEPTYDAESDGMQRKRLADNSTWLQQ